ncbi:FAD-linked oxidase C-terminal domain-containing protein [Streptomyces sp. NPDC056948]|uniref:FAD-linked oxidase C-terminal domain-containing protein n=1 Tax=Streptomyces sp. NPDC056948 TaxID=3345975 RepID=UPI00363238CF
MTAVIGAGIVPAAIEMLDNLTITTVEAAVAADYTTEAEAALVIELDGPADEVTEQFDQVLELCRRYGSTKLRVAAGPAERELIRRGRKAAFAAAGRLSPDYIVQDGVVPRGRLGEVLIRISRMADEAGLRVANVFHAGDGTCILWCCTTGRPASCCAWSPCSVFCTNASVCSGSCVDCCRPGSTPSAFCCRRCACAPYVPVS